MLTLLAGLLAGIFLSAPVGPMGALGVLQAVKGNMRAAYMLALGVCCADGGLALLATLGMGLPIPAWALSGCGMVLMLAMAIYLWRHAETPMAVVSERASFGIGASATLFHPGNVLAFVLVFNWLNALGMVASHPARHIILALGVVMGALSLWALLLHLAARSREWANIERLLPRFQKVLAAICLCASAGAAYELLRHW